MIPFFIEYKFILKQTRQHLVVSDHQCIHKLGKDTKGIIKLRSPKRTDNAMAEKEKRPKDKQYTKHHIENKSLSNM